VGFLLALGLTVAIVLVPVVGVKNLSQLVDVHLQASQQGLEFPYERRALNSYLAESLAVFALAPLSAGIAVRRKEWPALYLAGWVVAGYGLLANTGPTWYHHQLLVTVPAALLAAIAVATSIEEVRNASTRRPAAPALALRLGCLALFLVFLAGRGPGTIEGLNAALPNLSGPAPGEEPERSLLAAMGDHAAEVRWLYSDRPIFAFLTGLPIPPNLAVITQKRLLTGELTQEEIRATLEAYHPEMILNSRFGLPAVDEYMRARNYVRIDETVKYRLYLRRAP